MLNILLCLFAMSSSLLQGSSREFDILFANTINSFGAIETKDLKRPNSGLDEDESDRPRRKKMKNSNSLEDEKFGTPINYIGTDQPFSDITFRTTDDKTLKYYKHRLNSCESKIIREMMEYTKDNPENEVKFPGTSIQLNWLLNSFQHGRFTQSTFIRNIFESHLSWNERFEFMETMFKWECKEMLGECFVHIFTQQLPWPINKMIEALTKCKYKNGIKEIAKMWLIRVNEIDPHAANNESIIEKPAAAEFWKEITALGPSYYYNTTWGNRYIQASTLVTYVLPNVNNIDSDYMKIVCDNLLELDQKTSEDLKVTGLINTLPMTGCVEKFLKELLCKYILDKHAPSTPPRPSRYPILIIPSFSIGSI
jgi:hypothetical protein